MGRFSPVMFLIIALTIVFFYLSNNSIWLSYQSTKSVVFLLSAFIEWKLPFSITRKSLAQFGAWSVPRLFW